MEAIEMITTIKVKLVRGMYCEGDWEVSIELAESTTLVELHYAIQDAVNFDNDHSFSFFTSRSLQSRSRDYLHDDENLVHKNTLRDIFPLPPKRSFFYLFDWGDEWIFKISPTRKRPHEPVAGQAYPRVISESGTKPVQYPDLDDE
jgi:hypothetical protein